MNTQNIVNSAVRKSLIAGNSRNKKRKTRVFWFVGCYDPLGRSCRLRPQEKDADLDVGSRFMLAIPPGMSVTRGRFEFRQARFLRVRQGTL